jgi:hypothetical protein
MFNSARTAGLYPYPHSLLWASRGPYEQPGSDELMVMVPAWVDVFTVTLPHAKSRCQSPLPFWYRARRGAPSALA